jgi:hypothetical protein
MCDQSLGIAVLPCLVGDEILNIRRRISFVGECCGLHTAFVLAD